MMPGFHGGLPRTLVAFFQVVLLFVLGAGLARADLEDIRKSGILKVAVYNDFWPWAFNGKGVDADLADALAKRLGLGLRLMPFTAKDDVEDDLRNMVLKGNYLGYGPADVMMHVPVEPGLVNNAPESRIFAPYFRERIAFGYDSAHFPEFSGPDSVGSSLIGVERTTISAMVLLSADGGKYVNQVRIYDSAQALLQGAQKGEIGIVMATRAQIQAGSSNNPNFLLYQVDYPQIPGRGWSVGLAVKSENMELAHALQAAMDNLQSTGELNAICKKYGVEPASP